MKKTLVTLLLLSGFTLMAQNRPEHPGKRIGHPELTAEQIATLQTKKMTLALDLTQEQQNEIQKINLENAKLRKVKFAEIKEKKKEAETERLSGDALFALRNEQLDRKIAQKEQLKQLLTEEQFVKWEKMELKHRTGRRHFKDKKRRGKRR